MAFTIMLYFFSEMKDFEHAHVVVECDPVKKSLRLLTSTYNTV